MIRTRRSVTVMFLSTDEVLFFSLTSYPILSPGINPDLVSFRCTSTDPLLQQQDRAEHSFRKSNGTCNRNHLSMFLVNVWPSVWKLGILCEAGFKLVIPKSTWNWYILQTFHCHAYSVLKLKDGAGLTATYQRTGFKPITTHLTKR